VNLAPRISPRRRPATALGTWAPLLLIAAVLSSINFASSEPVVADGITVIVPGCVIDPNDIIGWWPGQDNLVAAIGPDLTGAVGFNNGLIGRAIALNGSNTIGAIGLETVSTGVTVEMWVKPTNLGFTGRTQALIGRWDFPSTDDSARAYALLLDPYGNLIWTTDETSTRRPDELRVPAPQLFDGEFHHVAATWTPTVTNIYVDGFLAANKPSQGGVLNPAATTPIRIGSTTGIGDQFQFDGIIDEPAIIKRALTAAEIDELVGAGPNGKCVFASTNGLVGPGLQVPGDAGGVDAVFSSTGQYLLFRTRSTNLFNVVTDPLAQAPGDDLDLFTDSRDDVVLLDRKGTSTTTDDAIELVSVNSSELGGELDSFMGDMTPNASHVVFSSISNDLVSGDTLAGTDVFLRNRLTGTTQRISVRSDGSQPQFTATGLNNSSREPSVNATGTVVANMIINATHRVFLDSNGE
jgi:Concanavalin A-like lectin/glucanases superfamily